MTTRVILKFPLIPFDDLLEEYSCSHFLAYALQRRYLSAHLLVLAVVLVGAFGAKPGVETALPHYKFYT